MFYIAGHIQGACSVEVNCYGKTIVFSGDIGRYQSELLPAPHHPAKADFVMMESTYGDRLHEREDIVTALAQIINDAISAGGDVLVPCFAVDRAQEVIHLIHKLKQRNAIPQGIPIYLDSPMASSRIVSESNCVSSVTMPTFFPDMIFIQRYLFPYFETTSLFVDQIGYCHQQKIPFSS